MDSVDKRVTDTSPGVTDVPRSGETPAHGRGNSSTESVTADNSGDYFEQSELRGPDLARAALQAARERSEGNRASRARKAVRPAGSAGGASRSRRRRWSGPGNDDRDPQPLGRLASRIANDRGWQGRLANGQVFGNWAGLVGDEVAEHSQPQALNNGELTVRASSTAWATQLRLLQGQLLGKIAAGVGHGVVKRLKVQGPVAPSWRRGSLHVSGRGPRDTYG
ncbi:putative nucleic acid-binding Zn ribbon protein [Tamaricihabitans halophyticus]|uniref:Putative nucleic acid-binding Zn ribbon protein n=1 Tax=Tamaricihabitans halophyticus TaxID=1262583 RepID=A0A4R2RDG4_9PSEU|nr:putative nucleic acid-binding Zn ribbon protein [Tamaricihabitans halophyticus]